LKSSASKIKLSAYDDIFETDASREELNREKVMEILLSEIDEFPNHPFKVRVDEAMQDMVESIKKVGILTPGVVRQKDDSRYELISGHRRKRACELAGIGKMPVLVKEMNIDEAIISMVDSNLQREELLPSEKAFSFKMRLDAMKRQGERTDLTSTPLGEKLKNKYSVEILGEKVGESRNQVQRFIRLTELIPSILEMADDKRIAFQPAVELSYLSKEEQQMLYKTMECEESTPLLSQAQRMKTLSSDGRLSEDVIFAIMTEAKPNQKEQFKMPRERISKYFSANTPSQTIEDTIIKALDMYRKRNKEMER